MFEVPTSELFDGTLHFALGFFPQPIPPGRGIASQLLFDDPWVCILRAHHPQINKRAKHMTLRNFLRIEHVRVNYPVAERTGLIGDALTSMGKTRKIRMTVPHLATIPAIVSRTDLLGTVPLRLAKEFAPALDLRIYPIPLRLPQTALALVWHETNQHNPAHA